MPFKRIEFMGLPGSGKSSSVTRFIESAQRVGLEIIPSPFYVEQAILSRNDGWIGNLLKKFPPKLWQPLCGSQKALPELHQFSYHHPELFASVFSAMSDLELPKKFRECISYDFYRTLVDHQLVDGLTETDGFVLFEEGFGQVGCLLTGYAPNRRIPEGVIQNYVKSLPPIHAIVWMDTDPSLCLPRLRKRKHMTIGMMDQSDADCMCVLEQSKQGFEVLSEAMRKHGTHVVRVEDNFLNSPEPAAAWLGVLSQFEQWFGEEK